MKRWSVGISILFFLFFISVHCYGQTLSINGTVTDRETGKPVVGASVFFSNTSYGTTSASNGSFIINNINAGKYDLIVSYVGYQTYTESVSLTSSRQGMNITLKRKAAELKEVVVRNYLKDGWQKWGLFFLENFIGTSALSKECTLKNPKSLRFSYSKQEEELTVDAMEPLQIENKALGYNIQYQLEKFSYKFNQNFLFYSGYILFDEMEGSDRKKRRWKEARADAYEVSQMRFYRSLYRNRLAEDGYQLFQLERIPNTERQRLKAKEKLYYDTVKHKGTIAGYENTLFPDSAVYYRKIIAQKDPIQIVHPGELKGADIAYGADSVTAVLDFKNYLIVRYPKRKIPQEYVNTMEGRSTLEPISSVLNLLNNQPIMVTSNGYYYPVENIITEGFWGWWEKLATSLPYDYKP